MMGGVTLSGAELGHVHFGSLQHGGGKTVMHRQWAQCIGHRLQRHNQAFT